MNFILNLIRSASRAKSINSRDLTISTSSTDRSKAKKNQTNYTSANNCYVTEKLILQSRPLTTNDKQLYVFLSCLSHKILFIVQWVNAHWRHIKKARFCTAARSFFDSCFPVCWTIHTYQLVQYQPYSVVLIMRAEYGQWIEPNRAWPAFDRLRKWN